MKRLLLPVFAFLILLSPSAQEQPTGPGAAESPVLSVFHFNNTRGQDEDQWMSRAFADGLNTRLASAGLTLVEREDLEEILKQQKLSLSGLTEEPMELGKILNATDLIRGSYLVLDGRLQADVKVSSAETGEILFTYSAESPPGEYSDLEYALAAALGNYYSVESGQKGVSESREALRLYYRGLLSLDEESYSRALEEFQASLEEDPLFQAPRDSIEESYRFLRDFRRARYQRELNKLYRQAANLLEQASQEPFVSWGDRVTALAQAGEDITPLMEQVEREPELTWGSTRAEVLWHAQTVMQDIARYSVEYFEDHEEAFRIEERIIALSMEAREEMTDDPFLPELIYQELLVRHGRREWEAVKTVCETLMFGWPDYRMMWAVEDFYENALEGEL